MATTLAALIVIALALGSDALAFRTSTTGPDVLDSDSPVISSSNLTNCQDVFQVYAERNIGVPKDTTDASHAAEETPLCSASWNTSCCTPTMERRYSAASKKDFQAALKSANSFLHSLLSTSADKLRDNFLEMVEVSRNNTLVLFSEVYKKMDARAPVANLYADLAAHLAGHQVALETRVAAFFDHLFPLVYHHTINPKLKDFSADYKECLRETRQEVRPFGDIADRVALHVARSFGVARTLLEALRAGLDVVGATGALAPRPECAGGLTRLAYCAHCEGHPGARACSGYCLNVARGCLAHAAELDQPWGEFVGGLERMAAGVVGSYNVEEVLSVLDTTISEAIMYAMENGPELSKKVKVACGHPRRAARDVSSEPGTVHPGTAPGRIVPVRSSEESLYVRLQQVVQRLAETKGHFANLADVVCSDEAWADRDEDRCWNGQGIGRYTKAVAGVGVSAQKFNPDMKAPDSDDTVIMGLDEKLQKMGRLLRLSTVPELPQADSYTIEGSGSGGVWLKNKVGDDEDYDGSGSGGGDIAGRSETKIRTGSDFNFDSSDPSNVNIKVKDSAMVASSSSALILSLLLVLFLPRFVGLRWH